MEYSSTMIPQIIGTKKSSAYRACVRFCKERGITFQERNPEEKPLSPTELDRIAHACGGYNELVDTESKTYRSRKLAWIDYDSREELLETPALLRSPIVRTDNGVTIVTETPDLESLFR